MDRVPWISEHYWNAYWECALLCQARRKGWDIGSPRNNAFRGWQAWLPVTPAKNGSCSIPISVSQALPQASRNILCFRLEWRDWGLSTGEKRVCCSIIKEGHSSIEKKGREGKNGEVEVLNSKLFTIRYDTGHCFERGSSRVIHSGLAAQWDFQCVRTKDSWTRWKCGMLSFNNAVQEFPGWLLYSKVYEKWEGLPTARNPPLC